MQCFVLFNGRYIKVSWVIWLRCHYCTNPTYHTMLLLLRGGELPGGPALFMRPPPDYFIFHPPPNIARPESLEITDLTHSYRDGLPPHLHNNLHP